jgi:hypothetical protein
VEQLGQKVDASIIGTTLGGGSEQGRDAPGFVSIYRKLASGFAIGKWNFEQGIERSITTR